MSPTRWIIVFMCVFSTVSGAFSNPPDWTQSLQFGLSQYYLGHLAESEAPLRLALEGAREHGDKVASASVLTDLGGLYLAEEDRFVDAEEAYSEALSIYKKTPSPQIGVVVALRGLGTAYALENTGKKAVSVLNDALRLARRDFASDVELMAGIQNSLGMAYAENGQPKKAEPLFEEVIRLTGQRGEPAFLTANALHNLAKIFWEERKYDEAESAYRRSIEITEEMFGSSYPRLAITRASLGLFYLQMGRLDEARQQLLISLRIAEQTSFFMPAQRVRILHNLGEIYARQGKFIEAEETLASAVDITRKNPEHDTEAVEVLKAYAALLERSGKADQAAATYREANRVRAALALTASLHALR
jgi:tetratricopeptide (TPR) repeat protein